MWGDNVPRGWEEVRGMVLALWCSLRPLLASHTLWWPEDRLLGAESRPREKAALLFWWPPDQRGPPPSLFQRPSSGLTTLLLLFLISRSKAQVVSQDGLQSRNFRLPLLSSLSHNPLSLLVTRFDWCYWPFPSLVPLGPLLLLWVLSLCSFIPPCSLDLPLKSLSALISRKKDQRGEEIKPIPPNQFQFLEDLSNELMTFGEVFFF